MKKIKCLIFLFLVSGCIHATAQDTAFLSRITEKATYLDADALGHIFYTDQQSNFYKKDIFTKRKLVYTDLRNGRIGYADISNPLRILLFYPDFLVIKFLDVNLSEINTYQIRENYQDGMIRLICASNNNGFWMYDENNRKLLRIGENFKTLHISPDLYQVTGRKLDPVAMLESGNELYLNDPAIGLLVFDLFGNYKKTIPIKNIDYFRFDNGLLKYISGNDIHQYNLMKLTNELIKTNTIPAAQFIFYKNGILYRDQEGRIGYSED